MNTLRSTSKEIKKSFTAHFTFMSIVTLVWKIVRILARIVLGAIIFVSLAHFVPEVKEQIPSFYLLVDMVLKTFEGFCSWLVTHM